MKLSFLGGAETVTGSKTLIETDRARVLVDCGLFQGVKSLRLRNWAAPPFRVDALDAVVLTHAHIDHSGWLPRLCTAGYVGPVYCTPGTRDLLEILLPDAGFLQEEEARHANARGWSKHAPALPLYTRADAEACLARLRPMDFDAPFRFAPGCEASFSRAGHIVGSACVALAAEGRRVGFSGDVGRPADPIMRPPAPLPACDTLVVESTYGDRRHAAVDVAEELGSVLRETFGRGGTAVIPAFAVGRTQHVIHLVAGLKAAGAIQDVPVYLDSPMAIDATRIFCAHAADHRLDDAACTAMDAAVVRAHTPDESKAIDRRGGPMIVISASGMGTGGRILHHLRRFLPEERNTVILVGFQAAGTRGRALVEGASEIKIFGDYVPVRARVAQISSLSAHADHAELLEWLAASRIAPSRVFVNHGEASAADAFRRRLVERFGWNAVVPRDGESFEVG